MKKENKKNQSILVKCKKKPIILFLSIGLILLVIHSVYAANKNTDASVTLGNAPPIISPLHTINNTVPKTNDSLFCSTGTYFDANSDPQGGQEWRWTDSGVLISGQTTQYLDLNLAGLDRGDTIKCESRVNDTFIWGSWYNSSNSAVIQSTPPIVSNVLIYSDPLPSTSDAYCNWTYSDIDNDPQNLSTVQWYKNSILIKTDTYTGTTPSLSAANYIRGDNLMCRVLGSDVYTNSTEYKNETIVVSNAPPTFSSISLVPNPAKKANTLTCSISGRNDLDGDIMNNYYEFLDSDNITVLQNWSTDSTMDCEFVNNCTKGDNITCVGYVTDGYDNSTFQNDTISIINTKPEAQTVYVFPFSPDTNFDLDCRHTYYDIDNDTENSTFYRWWNQGNLTNETGRYIPKAQLVYNETWRCEVTTFDGEENSTAVQSTQVRIGVNNPQDVVINSISEVDEGENFTVSWIWDDPQLPFGTPYYHYLCNSSNISVNGCADLQLCFVEDLSSPSQCIVESQSSWPSTYTVWVLVVDGGNLTSSVESRSFNVNHKPIANNVTMNVTSNNLVNTYTCNLNGVTDQDNDSVTKLYAFYDTINSTLLQSYSATNTFIVSSGEGTHGDAIECRGKAYDNRIYSTENVTSDHFRVYGLSYSSSIVVDQSMTFSVSISNTTNVTSANVSIKNPFFVQFSDIPLTYSETSGKWEYTFAPNIVGEWSIEEIDVSQADGQSYFFSGSGDTFTVSSSSQSQDQPSGGGATRVKEIVPVFQNLTGYCGDNICSKGENPANCWEDCKVNYDTLITCTWDKSIDCNWSQTWFPLALIVTLMAITFISLYVYQFRGKR